MRKIMCLFIILLFSYACFSQWELKDTIEFQSRNQLPNFFNKIYSEQTLSIGFLGGSITNAEGWRPEIIDWLKSNFNLDSIISHNAAISGTNSKYGVFRIDRHLLNKAEFDLIFIEFAVNDGSGSSPDVEKSMEGIVRKIWKNDPYTDICFVYTSNRTSLAYCEKGKMNLSASKHDSIASYYGIPSVYWTEQVYNMIMADTVVWFDNIENPDTFQNSEGKYVFTFDNLHPTSFGHWVYASVLARCLDKMKDYAQPKQHILKSAIFPDNYENSIMLPFEEKNNNGFSIIDAKDELSYLNPFIWESEFLVSGNSASSYYFSFFGNQMGLNLILGPSGGYYVIEIDGVKHELVTFDGDGSYFRRGSAFLKTDETRKHFVRIYPSPKELTLSDKRQILNTDYRKQDLDNNPGKYERNELIFSDIFIDGNLINTNYNITSICPGESISWQDKEFTEEGIYFSIDSLIPGSGMNVLDLKLDPAYYQEFSDTISMGDSIEWEGVFYKNPGEYIIRHSTITGCDSILKLNLSFFEPIPGMQDPRDYIIVYPNPCYNMVRISTGNIINQDCRLFIYNIFGMPVFDEIISCEDEIIINTSTYPEGVYFIKINNERAIKLVKINQKP